MKGVTVEEEYGKSVKLRREDVMMLKEWAEKQPHLPDIPELHLIFFLQSCRFSTEKAKATIESFFTYRAHWTEFFRDRDPTLPQLRAQLEVAGFLPLPKKTTHGHQIILFRFLNTDPSRFDVNAQIKLFDMCVTQWLMKNGTCEGFAVVCDLKGVVLGHILRANLTSIKRGIMYVQEALFTRLISIHLVNAGSYMDRIMSMIRPFLNEELINMVHCHQNFTLPKDIPVECLPSDYGSLQPSFQELQDANIKRLMDYAEYFRNEDTYIADETKRAVGSVKTTDIFGVEGSFKKLDID
ncbi:hypothetical protein PPYR_15378 [Photinus pyralis]|uniref:CRAL-TRIO domain-containing protein n=3 Tax=Photinus pyralis TaxID=7054 RepID=A0A5N3ZZ16_PHOPY|nr:hypothetical protein PPYR_15378 [Photinus pyralis]